MSLVLAVTAVFVFFAWLIYVLLPRTQCSCAGTVGKLEVYKMAVSANPVQYLFVKDVAIVTVCGVLAPLAAEDCHVEVSGPAVAMPVPDWAPEGTQFAFDVTARGTVIIDITTAKNPDLVPLEFVIDVDDPDREIVGNLIVADAPTQSLT